MGIPGLYDELGPGERISLAKYASKHHSRTRRRLRIAVDASIWSFQVQSVGSNPVMRTFYYRLLRLLSHNITPLFVFDGPHRLGFKRSYKKNTQLTPALIPLFKKLLELLGCPFHTAPGDAAAECALLNRAGVVDAVLSEDVDALIFGACTIIRNWSGEGKNTAPTHVTIYDSTAIDAETGLRREGLVLVSLIRGGDHLPEGIPGCGIKTAVEAARADLGDDLFAVRADEQRLAAWREQLQCELASNESDYFKRRNGGFVVPPTFPGPEILRCYAEPVVSDADKLARLCDAVRWDRPLEAVALREYARDTFEWRGSLGAAKFVRTLAPVLLAQRLWDGCQEAGQWISGLHGRRGHPSMDGCEELRISYTPGHVVPIDRQLEQEDDREETREPAGVLDDNDDDDTAFLNNIDSAKNWNPYATEQIWMLEASLSRSIPDLVRQYDDAKASNAKPKAKQFLATTAMSKASAPSKTTKSSAVVLRNGKSSPSMDRFPRVSKYGGNLSPKALAPNNAALSVAKWSVSQALPKSKVSGPPLTTASRSRGAVHGAPSTYAGRNSPSPAKAQPSIPPRNPIAPNRRSDPSVRSPAKPLSGALARALSGSASPTKISRTVSVSSPTRPSRTVSASSPTKNLPLHLLTSPKTPLAGMRAVSARTSSRSTRLPALLCRPPGSSRIPLEVTREDPQASCLSGRMGRMPAIQRHPSRSACAREGPPVGRLALAVETIDNRTPSPSRPSTTIPPLNLQVDDVQFQSPTEGLLIWMNGVPTPGPLRRGPPLASVRTRAGPTSHHQTPLPPPPPTPQCPSSERPRGASGTVAALVRNLETMAISSSPVLPETPLPIHAVPGKLVDFEAVQNSPNITIVRRRARKLRARLTDKESPTLRDADPPVSSPEEEELAACAGDDAAPKQKQLPPETVKVVLDEPGAWLKMDKTVEASAAAGGGCTIYEDVEIVDLTAV